MGTSELRKDPTVRKWLLMANLKGSTEDAYLQALQDYMNFTGKSPTAILKEAEDDMKNPPRERKLKLELSGFRKTLQDSGKAPHTIRGRITGMKSFFNTFDIEIPRLPHTGRARTLIENEEIPSKEDLQAVLKVCDPLETALVLVGASSGLAAAEICNLKISDFKKGLDTSTGITTLRLRREKVGFNFVTFLTPEATQAIQNYLDFRNRPHDTNTTRTLKQLEKQKVHTDNDFLFCVRNVPASYLLNHDDRVRKFDTASIMKLYRRLSEQAGQNTPSGNWNLIRSHNIRKFYNSALLNAGADSFFVEFTMGHTLDDTRAAYFRAQPEKLKDIYKKYIPYLTIQKENSISEAPEFKSLIEEIQALKGENEKLKLDRFENESIRKLKEEIEELKRDKMEREALRKEFSQVFEEDKKYWGKMDEIIKSIAEETGMTTDEVFENFRFDVPIGETLQEHLTKMHNDTNYRNKFKKVIKTNDLEKRENDIGRRAMKTLADEL